MDKLGSSSADLIQDIRRPVVMLSKDYEAGYVTDLHVHARAQFLFAKSGTMRAQTALGSWIVPPGYGLLIPADIRHRVEMFGAVFLRSAYVEAALLPQQHRTTCSVIQVSPLLSACIERFATRPLEYGKDDIAENLAAIIIAEITTTPASAMALPFPNSNKLKALAEAMLKDPSEPRSLDQWATELAMSRRSFTRAFRQETGMAFDQWRQRLRYQAASELIASGDPLSSAAEKVGYRSASALKSMMQRFD
ncbi:helix-turn-helix transcriptional regulator [uncultured Roseibium sp.]|uniref:AraC family transcriptional regulator n=1 Tax=uncultured Roseibium sp. TaxID=1936171 RepID=UPI0025981B96|nr:helix-turn-helix transcriptional regulator [uncultured Roseibium sp.]